MAEVAASACVALQRCNYGTVYGTVNYGTVNYGTVNYGTVYSAVKRSAGSWWREANTGYPLLIRPCSTV